MSTKITSLLIGLVLAWTGSAVFAQANLQIAQPGIIGMPPSAANNSTISFQYNIRNTGNQPFSGTVHTMVAVNGVMLPAFDTIAISNLVVQANHHVQVNNFGVNNSSRPFVVGRNGIVIWVADDNFAPLTDSLSAEITMFEGPAFSTQAVSLASPYFAAPNERVSFQVTVSNVNPELYKDPLFVHTSVDGVPFGVFQTADKITVSGNSPSTFELPAFKFHGSVFDPGAHLLRLWTTGLNTTYTPDSLTLEVIVTPATGLADAPDAATAVFPNPSRGVVTFQAPLQAGSSVQVMDYNGRLLQVLPAAERLDLSAQGLSAGSYWLLATLADGSKGRFKVVLLP